LSAVELPMGNEQHTCAGVDLPRGRLTGTRSLPDSRNRSFSGRVLSSPHGRLVRRSRKVALAPPSENVVRSGTAPFAGCYPYNTLLGEVFSAFFFMRCSPPKNCTSPCSSVFGRPLHSARVSFCAGSLSSRSCFRGKHPFQRRFSSALLSRARPLHPVVLRAFVMRVVTHRPGLPFLRRIQRVLAFLPFVSASWAADLGCYAIVRPGLPASSGRVVRHGGARHFADLRPGFYKKS